jgi:hypothetical protein
MIAATRHDRSMRSLLSAATSRYVVVSGVVSVASIAASQIVMELFGA